MFSVLGFLKMSEYHFMKLLNSYNLVHQQNKNLKFLLKNV